MPGVQPPESSPAPPPSLLARPPVFPAGATLELGDNGGRAATAARSRRPPPHRTPPISRRTRHFPERAKVRGRVVALVASSAVDVTSTTASSTEAAPRRNTPDPFLWRGETPPLVRAARDATPHRFPRRSPPPLRPAARFPPRPSARSPGPRRARSRASPRRPGHCRVVIGDDGAVLLRFLVPRPLLTAREGRGRLAGLVHRGRPRGRRQAGPHRRENERDGAPTGRVLA